MSDTPKTDEATVKFARILIEHNPFRVTELVPSDFARELERENADLRKQLERAEAKTKKEALALAAAACERMMLDSYWGYHNVAADTAATDCAQAIRNLSPTEQKEPT